MSRGQVFKRECYSLCQGVPFVQCYSPSRITPKNQIDILIWNEYLNPMEAIDDCTGKLDPHSNIFRRERRATANTHIVEWSLHYNVHIQQVEFLSAGFLLSFGSSAVRLLLVFVRRCAAALVGSS